MLAEILLYGIIFLQTVGLGFLIAKFGETIEYKYGGINLIINLIFLMAYLYLTTVI